MRVFLSGFAKVMTRTYEMQDRLKEARKVYKELKDEENERRLKAGANDYDVFDATFMSQDLSLAKVAEQAALAELPTTQAAVHLNSVEDESGSGCTSSASEHSPASPQPPQNTEEDVLMARTDAVNQYVAQQAESVSRISEVWVHSIHVIIDTFTTFSFSLIPYRKAFFFKCGAFCKYFHRVVRFIT
ncbi:unnamed protein product [Nippostrongylus brasiliensis]|uniref:DUF2040 domain-containing protein n=1 Tax=Nippostrongylus brasiliensis TaxID=27835 RepID=A0A0N4XR30_NIPBR|nr:unnamed protein product [Nippostrongylus brasiliensis]